MPKAKVLPSGNYRCRVFIGTENGKKKYKSFTAPTKKEAEYKATDYLMHHAEEAKKPLTLREAIENYIEIKTAVLSPISVATYEGYLKNYYDSIKNKPITEITLTDIQSVINELSVTLSPKSVHSRVSFIVTVLEYNDIIINTKKLRYPKNHKKEYATPTPENIRKIIEASKGTDLELPILLAVWLSLRMGEILGLEWKHIKGNKIKIEQTRVYAGGREHIKSTKTTGSERTLDLPLYIQEVLQRTEHTSNFVVPTTANVMRKKFGRLLEKNNIPHCRIHDLRHANASIMMMLGVPDKYAMARGGWSTPQVYKNVYSQTYEDAEHQISEQIDSYFKKLLEVNDMTQKMTRNL